MSTTNVPTIRPGFKVDTPHKYGEELITISSPSAGGVSTFLHDGAVTLTAEGTTGTPAQAWTSPAPVPARSPGTSPLSSSCWRPWTPPPSRRSPRAYTRAARRPRSRTW